MRIPTLITSLAICATAMAQSPLTTTFTSNNGQSGNMFDLVAANPAGVTIDYFDVNLDAGSWDLEVYKLTIPGPYLPSVNTAADWTLVGSTTGLVSNGIDVPTRLPISVCEFIPTSTTQSFYVTVTNGTAMNYTNGTTTGALFASNGDLEFYEGSGLAYPFLSNFNPRVFNGNIYYHVGNNPGSCTTLFASKTLFGTGCLTPGLQLDSTVPYLGRIWQITLDNIDPSSPLGVFAFGSDAVNPGFDLGPYGAAGCSIYSNANLGIFTAVAFSSSSQFNVLLPNQSSLLGATATLQAAAASPLNALGFGTSNGLSVVVGN